MHRVSRNKCFGGFQDVYQHESSALNCSMKFSLYLPASVVANSGQRAPALFYLSGLTCTEQNFVTKSAAQQHASRHHLILVGPDTSPRGADVPDSDETALGQGAGFYVNATRQPWSKHYQMYDYVTRELPELIEQEFPTTNRFGIFGHSMGGHGAIIAALRCPERFGSASAFAPIASALRCPWGEQALSEYLGGNRQSWESYDVCAQIERYQGSPIDLLIDQGTADEFIDTQLKPHLLEEAAAANPTVRLQLRRQDGYDHSYYFISTFVADHIAHHARLLS